jgi:hypothetical protein
MKVKIIFLTLIVLIQGFSINAAPPDEGMWLPMLVGRLNMADLQKRGFKLSAEEIYSVNKSSMKDAVVQIGGFCTGELISSQGLMLTNHHCAFSSIQYHSSVEHDYLTDGFWAKNHEAELACPEITASILVRMEDVTERIAKALSGLSDAEKAAKYLQVSKEIADEATKDSHYTARVRDMFAGNQHFLFVYEVFSDIRLVGAPPSSIGKFGGDTDNWMWPRHTGDFSMFRIYADKSGKPAAYSKENVPYTPKYFFPISLKGVQVNDFAMVYGFPGSTDRYQTASQLNLAVDEINPALIKGLGKRLEIMKKDMDASDEVRIKMADTYASLANSWKYYIGQNEGLKKLNVIKEKAMFESKFSTWAKTDATRTANYGNVISEIDSKTAKMKDMIKPFYYTQLTLLSPNILQLARTYGRLMRNLRDNPDKKEAIEANKKAIEANFETAYREYVPETDKKIFYEMLSLYHKEVPQEKQWPYIQEILKKYKAKTAEESFKKYVEDVFKKSQVVSLEKAKALYAKADLKTLQADPAITYWDKVASYFTTAIAPEFSKLNGELDELSKAYLKGMMEMEPSKKFYPDANSTLRVSYGTVRDYSPKDAVSFKHFTTMKGIIEKMDNTNEEFTVPDRLAELYKKKDFGQYGVDGDVPVGFITDNDITGGNSGSPVINGNGELIGVAFDGNWEAMTGDLVYDPMLKRTICVDIRYVLFVVDKYANSEHLVKEMKVIK